MKNGKRQKHLISNRSDPSAPIYGETWKGREPIELRQFYECLSSPASLSIFLVQCGYLPTFLDLALNLWLFKYERAKALVSAKRAAPGNELIL